MYNWGIVSLSAAALVFLGMVADPEKADRGIPGLIFFGGGGLILLELGSRHKLKVKAVAQAAYALLKEDPETLDLTVLSKKVSIPEIELRPLIAMAQKKNMLPFGFDLK